MKDGDGVEKDETKANDLFQRVASIHNGSRLFSVARNYEFGRGVSQDKRKAAELYQIAAYSGHIDAIVQLGELYEKGDGVTQNVDKAIELYQQAAKIGRTRPLSFLCERILKGDGFPQDKTKAIQLFQQLVDKGNTDAMSVLGDWYMKGNGVTQDEKKAIELYQQAAGMGNVNAMIKLGVWHAEGDFDTQDKVNAIQWFQQTVDLYKAKNCYIFFPHVDNDEAQQAKKQFIELVRQADEMGETDIITKLGIHRFDGVDTEQGLEKRNNPLMQVFEVSSAYAFACLSILHVKEKSVKQDTISIETFQRTHGIRMSVIKATNYLLFDRDDPDDTLHDAQKAHEYYQRLCLIAFTIARFMLEQLQNEQH